MDRPTAFRGGQVGRLDAESVAATIGNESQADDKEDGDGEQNPADS